MKNPFSHIQCVMFDLDGTIVNSVPKYFAVMTEALERVGLPPVPRSLIAEFMTDGPEVLKKMVPSSLAHRKEELIDAIITEGRSASGRMWHEDVEVFPGVERVFDLLEREGISLAVVTSTHRAFIDRKMVPLRRRGIAEALSAVVVIEDAPKRKPAPDPFLVCAERLKIDPDRCMVVGDSHVDIRAGHAAGMTPVGVLTGLDDRETLSRHRPAMILDCVADLGGWIET